MRIIPKRVPLTDAPILPMDIDLRLLVLSDFGCRLDRLALRFMAAGSLCSPSFFDAPLSFVGNDMLTLLPHVLSPYGRGSELAPALVAYLRMDCHSCKVHGRRAPVLRPGLEPPFHITSVVTTWVSLLRKAP